LLLGNPRPPGIAFVDIPGPAFSGYTISMKTAISIPDEVFKKAEQLARRLGMSRSQLYREAVEDYVNRRRPESITEAMNRVVDEVERPEDELVSTTARRVLERTESTSFLSDRG
jgi:predicted transcriptional regulator